MTIQRLNYTNRKKLTLEQAQIILSKSASGQPRSFEVALNLPAELPADASIIVEAYRSSPPARMRFSFGTVGAPTTPPEAERVLSDFGEGVPPPVFRVKIASSDSFPGGKLVAAAMRLRPIDPDEDPEKPRGILRTAWRLNEGPVWELDLQDELGPVLYIDARADPGRDLPTRPEFRALVYPEIIRRVLFHVVVDMPELSDEPGSWQQAWARFPCVTFHFPEPPPLSEPDREVREDWTDAAVRWCSRKAQFVDAMAPREVDE